jgi:protein TonB
MFTTLVESRAPKARRMGGTVVSAVVHGALIAGAVMVTLPRRVDANPKPREKPVVWVVPPDRRPDRMHPPTNGGPASDPTLPQPRGPVVIDFRPYDPIDVIVDRVPDVPGLAFNRERGGVNTTTPIGRGVPGELGGGGGIWDSHQVDRAPAIAGRAIEPRYPTQLRTAGIEGRVVLQFVVDTLGRAEPGDVTVIETSHPQFAEAVREVLPRYRFIPGEASGHRVRTRVQIPFDFKLAR